MTQFLLRNLIYQSNQELSPHSTLTVTIRLFTPNLILKSFTHPLTLARFGTIKIQMLILSDDPLMNLTELGLLRINLQMKKFLILNIIVLNVLSNFIPHEVTVCDDKDPPWFIIKSLFNEKLRNYNAYHKNIYNSQLRKKLSSLQQRLRDVIDDSKQKSS